MLKALNVFLAIYWVSWFIALCFGAEPSVIVIGVAFIICAISFVGDALK